MYKHAHPNSQILAITMGLDLAQIETDAASIVDGIGAESVAVYVYLLNEFGSGPVDTNLVFQFVFRSFYRLDNAGLAPDFKHEYFRLMERYRHTTAEIPLDTLMGALFRFRGLNHREGIQFSFVTKLASTICPDPHYPIYDSRVAKVFGLKTLYPSRSPEDRRIADCLVLYGKLRDIYKQILSENLIAQPRRMFRERYASLAASVPEVKVLDFIFWSAGTLLTKRETLRRSAEDRLSTD